MTTRTDLSRRQFLASGSAAAGALALSTTPSASFAAAVPGRYKTKRVILVAFAGGVRSKEVLGTPENVPNLMRIASAGVTLPNAYASNSGHYGAALSIFTGNIENLGIRANERGYNPTLFECLAKECSVDPSQMWLSTAGGAQAKLFAHSNHPQYGADYGANVLDSDGIFNVEFKRVLDSFGRPRADDAKDKKVLDALGGALDQSQLESLGGLKPDPDQVRRVERFILDELSGNTTRVTGPGAADAKAIRVGGNMLRVFKPVVLGISLQSHDIAHGSYNGYVEVIRRNDEELGKLWDAVQADEELRKTTAIMIMPEFGRDKNLNQRNGLDHGDGSDDLRKVFIIAAGPDFRTDRVIKTDCRTIDAAPTLYSLFSRKPMPFASSRVLKEIFA